MAEVAAATGIPPAALADDGVMLATLVEVLKERGRK